MFRKRADGVQCIERNYLMQMMKSKTRDHRSTGEHILLNNVFNRNIEKWERRLYNQILLWSQFNLIRPDKTVRDLIYSLLECVQLSRKNFEATKKEQMNIEWIISGKYADKSFQFLQIKHFSIFLPLTSSPPLYSLNPFRAIFSPIRSRNF